MILLSEGFTLIQLIPTFTSMYISDLTHFLDDKGEIPKYMPKEAREMAGFFALIVSATTSTPDSHIEQQSEIRCFMPGCIGNALSCLKDDMVHWRCPDCGNAGRISNWQQSKWDMRGIE